jgi:hypothetical protein
MAKLILPNEVAGVSPEKLSSSGFPYLPPLLLEVWGVGKVFAFCFVCLAYRIQSQGSHILVVRINSFWQRIGQGRSAKTPRLNLIGSDSILRHRAHYVTSYEGT